MNFYEDIKHKPLKKKHLSFINQKKNLDFLLYLENSIDEYLEKILDKKINLIEEISKLIIKTHTSLFQSINLNDKDLSELYFYKDYYTMGMYLPKNELIKYYDNLKFLKSEKKFTNIYKKNKNLNNKIDIYEISNFYNYTIAGSTNIAKALSYILSLIIENFENIEALKNKDKFISVETLSKYLIYEFYRFISIVNNQMISPFIYRVAREDIYYKNKIFIKKKENLWYFNTLDYFDSKYFKAPLVFNPFRWKDKNLKLPYKTFGIGKHTCCGTYFADKWLNLLLKKILTSCEIKKGSKLLNKQYNPKVKKVLKSFFLLQIVKKNN